MTYQIKIIRPCYNYFELLAEIRLKRPDAYQETGLVGFSLSWRRTVIKCSARDWARQGFFITSKIDGTFFLRSAPAFFSDNPPVVQFVRAGSLAQSSPEPVEELGAATKSYYQTVLDGVYDVVAPVVAKVKRRVKKLVDSSPPVQFSFFEYLKPYAKEQYQKMQALFRSYSKDLEALKNPLSRLSKILGRRRESKLDLFGKEVPVMARDLTAYGLMWELL